MDVLGELGEVIKCCIKLRKVIAGEGVDVGGVGGVDGGVGGGGEGGVVDGVKRGGMGEERKVDEG